MFSSRLVVSAAVLLSRVQGETCAEDSEVELCDNDPSKTVFVNGADRTSMMPMFLLAGALSGRNSLLMASLVAPNYVEAAEDSSSATPGTCGAIKELYSSENCCGNPDTEIDYVVVPKAQKQLYSANKCDGAKPVDASPNDGYFNNQDCLVNGVVAVLEQAGANVTKGYQGDLDATGRTPILTSYLQAGLCPVNVHWHLGAEHYSAGQFDEYGSGPEVHSQDDWFGTNPRRMAEDVRLGFRCGLYDDTDVKFTKEYNWKHCVGMHVGETYEVHWPHSAAGACGTPHQFQTPFYDGVFCEGGIISLDPLNTFEKIGVQSQVYTIVNDEAFYHPNLMRGMIVDGDYAADVAKYTGSTTGTSRNNEICSKYTPITWQVDRQCHLISASSFDKMCADMKNEADDMTSDLHAHGARVLVLDEYAANNHHRM